MNESNCISTGVHNSFVLMCKKNFSQVRGPKQIYFYAIKNVFMKESSKINKILGFAGQNKSSHGPQLARGPYFVHASIITSVRASIWLYLFDTSVTVTETERGAQKMYFIEEIVQHLL